MALSIEKTVAHGKQVQCHLCPKWLVNKYLLRIHLQRHSMIGKPFNCDKCSSAYRDKAALTRHLKYIHDPKLRSKFECPFCRRRFSRQPQLESHLSRHTKEKPYFCKLCPQEFVAKATLLNHQSIHESDRQRRFQCDICPMKFLTRNTLYGHRLIHTGKKAFKCEVCEKYFVKKTGLESHSQVHQSDRESFPCHICSKILASRKTLKAHLNTHNPEGMKERQEFECNLCARKVLTHAGLWYHIQAHLGERNLNLNCEICGETFPTSTLLKSHKSQVHADARRFRCDPCGKDFKTISHLKIHQANHRTRKTTVH